MSDELLLCPFCGMKEANAYDPFETDWYVRCDECGATGPVRKTKEESIATWNNRPGEIQRLGRGKVDATFTLDDLSGDYEVQP